MVRVKIGNILDCKENIIVHQVNVQGVMGGGVARQLANQYKGLEKEYSEFCKIYNNNYNLLKGRVFKIMLQGNRIDIFFNTHQEALNFGKQKVFLKIK